MYYGKYMLIMCQPVFQGFYISTKFICVLAYSTPCSDIVIFVMFYLFKSHVVFLFLTCICITLLTYDATSQTCLFVICGLVIISDQIFCSFLKTRLLFCIEISSHILDISPFFTQIFCNCFVLKFRLHFS